MKTIAQWCVSMNEGIVEHSMLEDIGDDVSLYGFMSHMTMEQI